MNFRPQPQSQQQSSNSHMHHRDLHHNQHLQHPQNLQLQSPYHQQNSQLQQQQQPALYDSDNLNDILFDNDAHSDIGAIPNDYDDNDEDEHANDRSSNTIDHSGIEGKQLQFQNNRFDSTGDYSQQQRGYPNNTQSKRTANASSNNNISSLTSQTEKAKKQNGSYHIGSGSKSKLQQQQQQQQQQQLRGANGAIPNGNAFDMFSHANQYGEMSMEPIEDAHIKQRKTQTTAGIAAGTGNVSARGLGTTEVDQEIVNVLNNIHCPFNDFSLTSNSNSSTPQKVHPFYKKNNSNNTNNNNSNNNPNNSNAVRNSQVSQFPAGKHLEGLRSFNPNNFNQKQQQQKQLGQQHQQQSHQMPASSLHQQQQQQLMSQEDSHLQRILGGENMYHHNKQNITDEDADDQYGDEEYQAEHSQIQNNNMLHGLDENEDDDEGYMDDQDQAHMYDHHQQQQMMQHQYHQQQQQHVDEEDEGEDYNDEFDGNQLQSQQQMLYMHPNQQQQQHQQQQQQQQMHQQQKQAKEWQKNPAKAKTANLFPEINVPTMELSNENSAIFSQYQHRQQPSFVQKQQVLMQENQMRLEQKQRDLRAIYKEHFQDTSVNFEDDDDNGHANQKHDDQNNSNIYNHNNALDISNDAGVGGTNLQSYKANLGTFSKQSGIPDDSMAAERAAAAAAPAISAGNYDGHSDQSLLYMQQRRNQFAPNEIIHTNNNNNNNNSNNINNEEEMEDQDDEEEENAMQLLQQQQQQNDSDGNLNGGARGYNGNNHNNEDDYIDRSVSPSLHLAGGYDENNRTSASSSNNANMHQRVAQTRMRISKSIAEKQVGELQTIIAQKDKLIKNLTYEKAQLYERINEADERATFLQDKYKDSSSLEVLRGRTLEQAQSQLSRLRGQNSKLTSQIRELQEAEKKSVWYVSQMESAIEQELQNAFNEVEQLRVVCSSYKAQVVEHEHSMKEMARCTSAETHANSQRIQKLESELLQFQRLLKSKDDSAAADSRKLADRAHELERLNSILVKKEKEEKVAAANYASLHDQLEVVLAKNAATNNLRTDEFSSNPSHQQQQQHGGRRNSNEIANHSNQENGTNTSNTVQAKKAFDEEISRVKIAFERQIAKLNSTIASQKEDIAQYRLKEQAAVVAAQEQDEQDNQDNLDSRIINIDYLSSSTSAAQKQQQQQQQQQLNHHQHQQHDPNQTAKQKALEQRLLGFRQTPSSLIRQGLVDFKMTTEFAVLMNNVGDDEDDEEGGGDALVAEFVQLVANRLNSLKADVNQREHALADYSNKLLAVQAEAKALKQQNEMLQKNTQQSQQLLKISEGSQNSHELTQLTNTIQNQEEAIRILEKNKAIQSAKIIEMNELVQNLQTCKIILFLSFLHLIGGERERKEDKKDVEVGLIPLG